MKLERNNPMGKNGLVKLSEVQSIPAQSGISIVSCCMNRNKNLKRALKTWLKLDVDEIIIVDWSSKEPVAQTLLDIDDSRIKVVRVEGELKWVLTYAFNVGLRLASYRTIYKLDADIEVSPEFLSLNQFGDTEFIRGHWKTALDEGKDSQVYVNGSFGCDKNSLLEIGFYNEFIRTYGWDDTDLYARLSINCGLKTNYLSLESINHIEQDESDRIVNQDVKNARFLGQISPTEFNNIYNKYLVSLCGEWRIGDLQDYKVHCVDVTYLTAERISPDYEIPELYTRDAALHASLYFIRFFYKDMIFSISAPRCLADQLLMFYDAGIDFAETKSAFAIDDAYPVMFSRGSDLYACFKLLARKKVTGRPLRKTLIYTVSNCAEGVKRMAVHTNAGELEIVITSLPEDVYEDMLSIRKDIYSLSGGICDLAVSSTYRHDMANCKVLATSVYDERKPHRVQEYLSCIKRNIELFDILVLFYEEGDGSFIREVNSKLGLERDGAADCQIVVIKVNDRPTFRFMFNTLDSMFAGAKVFVSNADIAFDDSIEQISPQALLDNFLVISRKETIPYSQSDNGRVIGKLGLPNVLSSDVWVYQAPLRYTFRADFPIGSFYCDSFLNYHISKSGYNLYNPCLDIEIFHIHDEKYNPSLQKREKNAQVVQKMLVDEVRICNGEFPVVGVQWCRYQDCLDQGKANQVLHGSNVVINISIDSDGRNLYDALIKSIMCMKINSHMTTKSCVWSSIGEEALHTSVADLLFGFKEILNNPMLAIGVISEGKSLSSKDGSAHGFAAVSSGQLVYSYEGVLERKNIEVYGGSGCWFTDSVIYGNSEKLNLACDISTDQTDLSVYFQLKSLREKDKRYLFSVLSVLIDRGHGILKPFLDDLSVMMSDEFDLNPEQSLLEGEQEECFKPDISFITSVYDGEEYFDGFLENIAAAILECNGEVIMIDAASPGDEQRMFSDFIEEYPALSARMRYVRLDSDPGLYNCWRMGIDMSSAEFVGNANLDDRRSPFQAKKLLAILKSEPKYAGAATAIRATRARNTGWYALTESECWFNQGFDQQIDFSMLYVKDENGYIKSQNIMHCMPVWRKSLHNRYGFFDEEKYGTSADWAFWLECTKNGELFALVPNVLSQYFINESSHNRVNDPQGIKENRIISDYLDVDQSGFEQQ